MQAKKPTKGKINNYKKFHHKGCQPSEEHLRRSRLQTVEEIYAKSQTLSQQCLTLVPKDEYGQRDATEETEFDERYFAIKAALLQLMEKLKPPAVGPSTSSGGSTGSTAVMQVLEQQTILIQRSTERSIESSSNDALTRIMEQQNQLLDRLGTRTTPAREPEVKLPMIRLPTFDGNMEEWKRYSNTFKTLIHDSELTNVQKHPGSSTWLVR